MKKKQYSPRILALLLAVLMVFGLMPTAYAQTETILVDAVNGDDSGDAAAYQTLQAAYDAASNGGSISLQSNIELDTRYLDFNMDKSVTIEGNGHVIEYTCADHIGTEQCGVITCSQGQLFLNNLAVKMPDQRGTNGRLLYVGPAASVETNNVSFLNGYSAYVGGGVYVDGGMFEAIDTIISNCYVANTMEAYGGGLYANGGSVSFSGEISGNTMHSSGGYSNYGGGIAAMNGADVTLAGASIQNNIVDTEGAGVYFSKNSSLTLLDKTVITGNSVLGEENNLYFIDADQAASVKTDLSADSSIGIIHGAPAYNVVIGLPENGNFLTATEDRFTYDTGEYDIRVKNNTLILYPFVVSVEIIGEHYDASYPEDGETPYKQDFDTTIIPDTGYQLPGAIQVNIGGTPSNDYTYDPDTGKVHIDGEFVVDDIQIVVDPDALHTVTITLENLTIEPEGLQYVVTKHDTLAFALAANDRYALPETIAVTGSCSYDYNPNTGAVRLSGITSNVTVEASAAEVYHTIAFDPNGGTLDASSRSKTIKESDSFIGPLPLPTMTGYTFTGWFTASGSKVLATDRNHLTEDITLTAHWSPDTDIPYTVHHWLELVDSGTNPGYEAGITKTQRVLRDSKYLTYYLYQSNSYNDGISDGTKNISHLRLTSIEGLDTEGFSANASNVYEVTMQADGSSEYPFFYDRNTYTVTFDPTEGKLPSSAPATSTVTYGNLYGTMPEAERTGYRFIGWFTEANGGSQVLPSDIYLLTHNQVLYAHWAPLGNTAYTVIHMTQKLKDNLVSTDKTPDNYEVYTTEQLTGTSDTTVGLYAVAIDGFEPSDDNVYTVTITANGKATAYLYYDRIPTTIHFDGNGGILTDPTENLILYHGGSFASLPAAPYRVGYDFTGWYTGISEVSQKVNTGTGLNAIKPDPDTRDITLYAHWSPKDYTLVLDSHGGTINPDGPYTVTYDTAIGSALPSASLTGYTFDGWYTEDGKMGRPEGEKITAGTLVNKDTIIAVAADRSETVITLYAWYRPNTYTLHFDAGAGTVSEASRPVVYESRYGGDKALPIPVRTGYNFIGWYFDFADEGTKITNDSIVKILADSTVHAMWEAKTFRVDLDAKGGTVEPGNIVVTYDSTYGGKTPLPTPNRPGYDFDGWYNADNEEITDSTPVKITENETLTAHWTAKTYTVTFDSTTNGGEPAVPENKQVTYDAAYGQLPEAKKEGSTFKGWFTAPDGGSQVKADTIVKILENQTLYAQYAPISMGGGGGGGSSKHTITVTKDANAVVTPDGKVSVEDGGSQNFKISAQAGYMVVRILVDGKEQELTAEYTFKDVKEDHTLEVKTAKMLTGDHISYIEGYSNGTVQPDSSITRAEVAAIFYRLLTPEARQAAQGSSIGFSDSLPNAWYADAVSALASMGIVIGYADGSFQPDSKITRAEFAAVASRFDNLDEGSKEFSDVPQSHWAYTFIASAAEKGWVNGYPDGTFRPDASITRAEAVKLINAVLGRFCDKGYVDTHESLKSFTDLKKSHWAYYEITEAANGHDYEKAGSIETWIKLK